MSQVSTTSPGSKINDATGKVVRTRSRFPDMSYSNYNTDRFGMLRPFFVMEGVEGDHLPIRSSHEVRSYTLKAPLMQNIRRNKDFFMVGMPAILPLNWEKFYMNPNLGDDVPDDVGTGFQNFWQFVKSKLDSHRAAALTYISGSASLANKLTYVLRLAIVHEMFYSNGNLISALGCHVGHRLRIEPKENTTFLEPLIHGNYDTWFDLLMQTIISTYTSFTFVKDGDTRTCVLQPDAYANATAGFANAAVSFHDFLEYLRDDLNIYIDSVGGSTPIESTSVATLLDATKVGFTYFDLQEDYNLARLWAYQLSTFHFYTNDKVDFVYSAGLFRELISYYVRRSRNSAMTTKTFTYNGIPYEYDALSAGYAHEILGQALDFGIFSPVNSDDRKCQRGYLSALFSYRRSLRFVDYFTGSRTRPLAVGNVDANVVSNKVNVVDITMNIQKQKFLNSVARTGRKVREYIKMLGGTDPGPDYHDPLYLGHTSDNIFGVETENTGAGQLTEANSVTSRFQSNGSRYQFEVDVDLPCVIIGISYYDIKRIYVTTTDRQLHHMNRFDMFNPFMQFIGDQDVKLSELGSLRVYTGADYPFGYQLRHMEYKQRFSVASGGFVDSLPGFIFDNRADAERTPARPVVDEDFIRSLPSELDRFYVSLTGFSLGHYFHFIVRDDNSCDASRPMAYAPSIL